jgi:tetratricopeptide (TPR) repeat protein
VIRGTVDFDVRTHHLTAAVATLLQAASVATPKLARDFTLEAANRANDSGATAQGRSLALGLLSANPYDAQALALDAASYSRKNDDAGLKTFYLNRLDSARMDPSITVDTRRENVALLRRGLIPALTRLGDFAGAEDQYIALLSAFPEDAGTANQAIQYAMERGRQKQLASFLETTVKQSPRDSRLAILLGRADVAFGNLPAALAAYDQAISVRQDRVDLYQARAALELQLASLNAGPAPAPETLLDRAADDFARLYQLSYQDPQYQVSVAEVRARQGRTQAVVAALETAYVAGRPTTGPVAAAAAFKVAAKLEGWNLLPQARIWAEKGVALAGADLLLRKRCGGSQSSKLRAGRLCTRAYASGPAGGCVTDARRRLPGGCQHSIDGRCIEGVAATGRSGRRPHGHGCAGAARRVRPHAQGFCRAQS